MGTIEKMTGVSALTNNLYRTLATVSGLNASVKPFPSIIQVR